MTPKASATTAKARKQAWGRLVVAALRGLQADDAMVPGAKLRQQMEQVGVQESFDVRAYVHESGRPFLHLVADVEGITIARRPGSDVLVGLQGAQAPTQDLPPAGKLTRGLRQDVFQAFTQMATTPFVYLPDRDKFIPEDQAEGPSVPVPSVKLEQLIGDRRDFLEELPPEERKSLIDALDRSSAPLAHFRQVLQAKGLARQWAFFQTEVVRSRVQEWAQNHKVTPRKAWFQSARADSGARRTLARLTPYLTTDEIRGLLIPLRAVEAMLSASDEQ